MQLKLFGHLPRPGDAQDRKEATWAELGESARVVIANDGGPIRQIAPRSRLPVGRYNSRKAGRMLHHQSRGHGAVGGEKLAMMLCEIDPAVVDYRSQQLRFDLFSGDGTLTFFPDIVRLMHDGTISVVEVKKDNRWQGDPAYRAKLGQAAEVCRDLGWRFEVWTADMIAPTARVRDNISEIQMERFIAIDSAQILVASRTLTACSGEATAGEITAALGNPPAALSLLRGMMCRGILTLPLEGRIGRDTIVTRFDRCLLPQLEHAA